VPAEQYKGTSASYNGLSLRYKLEVHSISLAKHEESYRQQGKPLLPLPEHQAL
jgi:hypothetical protein